MSCPQQNCLSLYCRKNVTCWNVGLVRVGQVSCVFCEVVCRWVASNCCSVSDINTLYYSNCYLIFLVLLSAPFQVLELFSAWTLLVTTSALVWCLLPCSTAACCSGQSRLPSPHQGTNPDDVCNKLVNCYKTVRRHIPECCFPRRHDCESVRSGGGG